MQETYEIIICGGGVGGLALAIALGLQGRRVLVLEKHHAEVQVHRGELLQPRTLEILEKWGVLQELQTRGSVSIAAMEARNAQGVYLGELNYELLPERYNHGLTQYYHEIKSALYTVASNLVEIRYGTSVSKLERDAWGTVVGVHIMQGRDEKVLRAHLIVGADGRTSQVRREIGINARIFEYPHQLMGFDLIDVQDLQPRMCAFLSKHGVRVLYPMPGHHARLYVQIKPGEFSSIKRMGIRAWKQDLLAQTPGLHTIEKYLPEDFSSVQIQGAWSYSAPSWSKAGVALLGDAAHYVHPTAGQGMNAAIIDAWSLADALAAATEGRILTSASLQHSLAIYDERRRDFDFVGMLCHRLALFCTSTTRYRQALAYWSLRANRHNQFLQYRIMRNIAGYSAKPFSFIEHVRQYMILPDSLFTLVHRQPGDAGIPE